MTVQIGRRIRQIWERKRNETFTLTNRIACSVQGSTSRSDTFRSLNVWEPKNDKRREFLRGVCRPAFRLPARLAVGFGLETLPASGRIHPGRWQAVANWFPRSSAPRIRLTNHHHGWRQGESIPKRANVNSEAEHECRTQNAE